MKGTFFIAPTRRQAKYWAREWNFKPNEWMYLGCYQDTLGLGGGCDPENCHLYVCGPTPEGWQADNLADLFDFIEYWGGKLIDAQADTEEQRSGLYQWAMEGGWVGIV